MARGKKKSQVPAENISDEGALKLDDISRLNLLRLEAESNFERSQATLDSINLDRYLQQIDPAGKVRAYEAMIQAHTQKVTEKTKEYQAVLKAVGEKLGIDMQEYAFDDESGILHKVEDPKDQK